MDQSIDPINRPACRNRLRQPEAWEYAWAAGARLLPAAVRNGCSRLSFRQIYRSDRFIVPTDLSFRQVEAIDQFFGTGRHVPQLVGNVLFFGDRSLLEFALDHRHLLSSLTSALDFFLSFTATHVGPLN